jgi:hypothetical protein
MNGGNYVEGDPINQIDPNGQVPFPPPPPSPQPSSSSHCELIKTLPVEYEPFVYTVYRMGQVVHVRWVVKDFSKCSLVQYIDDAERQDTRVPFIVMKRNELDAVWDLRFSWNSTYLKYKDAPQYGSKAQVIELIDTPGFGNGTPQVGVPSGWLEFWFNARDYLYDKLSAPSAIANSTPVSNSSIAWGFKFGGSNRIWEDSCLNADLAYYEQGSPGLPDEPVLPHSQ